MEYIEMSNSKPEVLHGSYTVKAGDSLMSIAARVGNVTPAQLARFNRLGMLGATHPPLFPGQKLYIPNKDEVNAQNVRLRHLPGTATRVHCLSTGSTDFASPTGKSDPLTIGPKSSSKASTLPSTPQTHGQEGVMEKLFVKINAKRVLQPSTCQIDGVLIITPDAVCFDATATASALTRATAAKRITHPHSPANDSKRGDDLGEPNSPRIHSPAPEPVLEAADPVHDVLALSVCIPIGAVVSLNTHGDMNNLLSGCRSKAARSAPSKVDLPDPAQTATPPADASSDTCTPTPKDEAENATQTGTSREGPEHEVEGEEVFISIGVDTERILSSVPPVAASDQTTLHEAASTNLHVFKIPLDKLADIHDILVAATNLAASQVASSEQEEGRKLLLDQKRPPSMIESALEEMARDSIELTLVGGTSSILDEAMLKDLARGLPPSRMGNSLKLVFSTARDGFSLNTLYRKTQFVQDVNLLLIRDYLGSAFGALLSERMHCSQHFYGTGESCVFHWRNGFKCYNWTKKNYFFMQGSHDSFLIGAKSGHSAIWFDGDLKYGRSEATDTFDNPVLCSIPASSKVKITREKSKTNSLVSSPSANSLHDTTSVAFVIDALEVWEMIA